MHLPNSHALLAPLTLSMMITTLIIILLSQASKTDAATVPPLMRGIPGKILPINECHGTYQRDCHHHRREEEDFAAVVGRDGYVFAEREEESEEEKGDEGIDIYLD